MRRKFLGYFLFCILTFSGSVAMADHHDVVDDGKPERSKWITSGGGCVGGAILGSFIPVIGTAVGCVVGGVAGFFVPTGNKGDEVIDGGLPDAPAVEPDAI